MILAHMSDGVGLRILHYPNPTYSYPCFVVHNKSTGTDTKIYFDNEDDAFEALYEWVSKYLTPYDMDTLMYTTASLKEFLVYSELFSRWLEIKDYADLIGSNISATVEYERIKI